MKKQSELYISNNDKSSIYTIEYICRKRYGVTQVGHLVLIPMLFFSLSFFAFIWDFLMGEYVLGIISLLMSFSMIPLMLVLYPTIPANVRVYNDRIEFTDTKWGRLKLSERIIYFSTILKGTFFTHPSPPITTLDFETNDGRKYELDIGGVDKKDIDNLLSSLKKLGVKVEKS